MLKDEAENNFCPYLNLNTQEYLGLLLCLNQTYLNKIQKKLSSLSLSTDLTTDFAILAVGSDGKKERHPRSRTELIIVGDNLTENVLETTQLLDDNSEFLSLENQRIGGTEVKIFNNSLSYYKNQTNNVYPDRILNTVFVAGNPEVHKKARIEILKEMSSASHQATIIREKMKKQLLEYLKAAKTGIYRKQPVFSITETQQYYLESSNYLTTGFKIPFLRTVQRLADLLTVKLIDDGKMSIEQAAVLLPTVTVNRLELLSNFDYIQNPTELVNAYTWFLQKYHHIQENNRHQPNQISTLRYNPDEFTKHSQIITQTVEEFLHIVPE